MPHNNDKENRSPDPKRLRAKAKSSNANVESTTAPQDDGSRVTELESACLGTFVQRNTYLLRALLQESQDKLRALQQSKKTHKSSKRTHRVKEGSIPVPPHASSAKLGDIKSQLRYTPKQWRALRSCARDSIRGACLNWDRGWKAQSTTKLGTVYKVIEDDFPELRRFEGQWAVNRIVKDVWDNRKMYINCADNINTYIGRRAAARAGVSSDSPPRGTPNPSPHPSPRRSPSPGPSEPHRVPRPRPLCVPSSDDESGDDLLNFSDNESRHDGDDDDEDSATTAKGKGKRRAGSDGGSPSKRRKLPFGFWITRRSAPDETQLFDTRTASLPPTPIEPVIPGDNSTALDSFNLVFENQYLQIASTLPLGANKVVASSGIRRDIGTNGGAGTIPNNWGEQHQHFIPIVDSAIAKEVNSTDIYDPYRRGAEIGVFMRNPDGSDSMTSPFLAGFPRLVRTKHDQLVDRGYWSQSGIEFSGIWLDMNEATSFCDGSCGSGIDISNTSVPILLPGAPGNLVTDYPEGYNATISGPSGNLTINGTLTFTDDSFSSLSKRGIGAGNQTGIDINAPPYAIHNGESSLYSSSIPPTSDIGNGPLSIHTLATNGTHFGGYADLDTHNLWGLMETIATHKALQTVLPRQRPFIITRSTFPSSGKWGGHWLEDNFSLWHSLWQYMHASIQGVLQFQPFGIPFVGADTCGFTNNSDGELYDIFTSLYYTLFANASMRGTPPIRPLFWEFPNEPEFFAVDRQFLIGRDILVTPVLTPNVSTVDGIFPGRGKTMWRDWYTHVAVDAKVGVNTTLDAPLGHINIRAYTVEETRTGPFELLVSLAAGGGAFGSAYLDDGISDPPGPSTTVIFHATKGALEIQSQDNFEVAQKMAAVTVLGVSRKPMEVVVVVVAGKEAKNFVYKIATQELVVSGLEVDLNRDTKVTWR
ncbi:glycosyl hydrolases family 31-domain-containing protein [Roridomyces roridus]|uniref:Glycosyl hydrolases family 31-domain-containing protein n=1 Tax=Roridomyces roridus TaxID=1738132 RepID=A0AAD7B524_9AGAR|nr:glycosyl hydrolases family 31-domain-containing protein [Roridomyces roridus]